MLAVVCATLLLASCGGGGGSSGASTPAGTGTSAGDATAGAYADQVQYSGAATAALATATENAAVIAAHIQLNGTQLNYTATSGHLTATDAGTGKPSASFFYVAYTVAGGDIGKRPVTFFYNGGPGSASLWLHLGSFGPRRLVTTIPNTVQPSPAQLVDNQETLLAQSDLVFIDAIGTGYSEAIAPHVNRDFWGVDQDAAAFRDFITRYVSVNGRQNSPKFLYGESYGTPRTGVLANLLETAGVQIEAVVLQSSIMNYNSNCDMAAAGQISCEGYVPSYAALGAYYMLDTPQPADLGSFLDQVRAFDTASYRPAVAAYLATRAAPPAGVLTQLADDTGIALSLWQQNPDLGPTLFQSDLLPGQLIGRYDGRVHAPQGSALTADGDPSLTAINDMFVSTMQSYLTGELHYSAPTSYISSSDPVIDDWDFSHDGLQLPDTIPDLAAALTQNPFMQVLSLNGYDDLATPFHQTELDLARLASANVQFKYYSSGHMIYLDDTARRAQQADLINFYASVTAAHP